MPPVSSVLRRTLREFSKTHYAGVLSQLQAGSRYLDLRISRATHALPKGGADRFWIVHGAVACVPLAEVLGDLRAFQGEDTIVTVVRLEGPPWDMEATNALAARFFDSLGHDNIYQGSVAGLREVEYSALPAHVVAGVPGIGSFGKGQEFGTDVWINTYNADVKSAGLETQLKGIRVREERDDLCVLGWTVTPQPKDIVKRILTFGCARPSLETEAEKFNKRFKEFVAANGDEIRKKCNVVFFDFITSELSEAVVSLNKPALE